MKIHQMLFAIIELFSYTSKVTKSLNEGFYIASKNIDIKSNIVENISNQN